jgi:MFS family permease
VSNRAQFATAEPGGVESRRAWAVAAATLAILSVSYGAPLLVVVGLEPITADLGVSRSAAVLASSAAWLGAGVGGILAGRIADRIGVRWTVAFGALALAAGLAASALGGIGSLWLGHLVLIGALGTGAIYPPLVVHVSRWFDRRRGTALALISSGQYVAGALWPIVFEHGIARFGWRHTMLAFGGFEAVCILPLALLLLRAAAPPPRPAAMAVPAGRRGRSLQAGLPASVSPRTAQAMLCAANFLCCVPMALPMAHLVAFCSDLGIAPASGALMLSTLLGAAFVSRQAWGWLADRIGGLPTILAGSICQAVALAGFLATRGEVGLFTVSAAFGLGFSGIVPAYVLVIRQFFPAREASWRVPVMLLCGTCGMAFGGWLGGAIYDRAGSYGAAFLVGIAVNLVHIALISTLLLRVRPDAVRVAAA